MSILSDKMNDVFRRSNILHCHKALYWFELSQKRNAALMFRRRTRTFDSMLFRALFYMLPLFIIYFNFAVNMLYGTFWQNDNIFTYLEDWGSSFCNNAFFIFTYLLSSYYSEKLLACKKIIFVRNFLTNEEDQRESLEKAKKVDFPMMFVIIGFVIGLCGYIFIRNSMPENYWLSKLPFGFRVYFLLFSCVSWSMFVSLIIMVYEIGFIVFYCANDRIGEVFHYNDDEYDQNESVIELLNIITANFSFALLYIGIGFLYVFCYVRIAERSKVPRNIIHHGDFIMATVITIVVIFFIYLYVPYKELLNNMKVRRLMSMSKYDDLIKKTKNIQDKEKFIESKTRLAEKRMSFSTKNIITVITSILFPIIGWLTKIIFRI